jgi:hypothetical protein
MEKVTFNENDECSICIDKFEDDNLPQKLTICNV